VSSVDSGSDGGGDIEAEEAEEEERQEADELELGARDDEEVAAARPEGAAAAGGTAAAGARGKKAKRYCWCRKEEEGASGGMVDGRVWWMQGLVPFCMH